MQHQQHAGTSCCRQHAAAAVLFFPNKNLLRRSIDNVVKTKIIHVPMIDPNCWELRGCIASREFQQDCRPESYGYLSRCRIHVLHISAARFVTPKHTSHDRAQHKGGIFANVSHNIARLASTIFLKLQESIFLLYATRCSNTGRYVKRSARGLPNNLPEFPEILWGQCLDGRARFPWDPFAVACQHGRANQPI
jgi:hypothetical protein